MTFLILVAVVAIAYFVWRIVDQLPDLVYRLSEIQRDVADIRRRLEDGGEAAESTASGDDAPAS